MSESIIKILVVEDDAMVMKVLVGFLGKISATSVVDKAMSIAEAKKSIQRRQIDLIVLDVFLPDGKGTELLKWIRTEHYQVDVLMITADQSTSTLEQAMRYGVRDYLVKPVKFEDLQNAMNQYKQVKKTLAVKGEVDVKVIKELFKHEENPNSGQNQTLHNIKTFLEDNEGISYTSTEIANALGISRITARRYLELLESTGDIELELSYGTVGRPKNKYLYQGDSTDDH